MTQGDKEQGSLLQDLCGADHAHISAMSHSETSVTLPESDNQAELKVTDEPTEGKPHISLPVTEMAPLPKSDHDISADSPSAGPDTDTILETEPDVISTSGSGEVQESAAVHEAEIVQSIDSDHSEDSTDAGAATIEEFDTQVYAGETEALEPAMTAEMLDAMDTATLVTLLTEACRHVDLRTQRDQISVLRPVLNDRFEMEKRRARAEFLAAGGLEEDYSPEPDPLFLLFMDTISKYQQRRQQEREQRDREHAEGLRKKEEILVELVKAVEQEENGVQLEPNTIKGLQQRWNESGHVPAEHRQEIWKRFHALIDRFYANLRINRELKELDMQKNLAFKIGLCEQAESLMLMSDLNKALSTLSRMHELWKSTGPAPREQREEVWQRFKLASDRLHERRRERLAEMDAVYAENLQRKSEVIAQLKDILNNGLPTTPAGWNEMGQQIEKLQADWRAVGPVTREKQDELWKNFRSLLSTFFEQRGQFFKERKQEWGQLRMEAERICSAAEYHARSSEWRAATEALNALQEDWKKCNALPHKIREKYWVRFKSAKKQFFGRKKEHFKDRGARHAETKELLESIVAEVEAFVASGEHKADLEALQAFQRRWTAAPPLPLRMREAIHNRYRDALQPHYDRLHVSSRSGNHDSFKHTSGNNRPPSRRDRSTETSQNYDPQARRDRNRLQIKLSELENDIRLWENNIHFFSMSKNADVLRAEVQFKIDNAKKEADRLKAQITQIQSV